MSDTSEVEVTEAEEPTGELVQLHASDSAPVLFPAMSLAQRIEVARETVARGLTNPEFAMFLEVCNRTGLDPFARQIYALPRGQGDKRRVSIQTSIDGFRLIAQRTGLYGGILPAEWCGDDGVWRAVWPKNLGHPVAARARVIRKDWSTPCEVVAHWDEYCPAQERDRAMWDKMPAGQLAKCAFALAYRTAFPQEMSGVYTHDEMAQAVDVYEAPPPPPPPEMADPEALWEIQARIRTLPDESRAELFKAWEGASTLSGRRPYALDERGVRIASALVMGIENRAEAAGWDKAVARDVLTHRLAVVVEEFVGGHGEAESSSLPDDDPEPDEPEPEPEVPTIPHDTAEAPSEAPVVAQETLEGAEEAKPPPKPPVDSETPSLAHEVSSLMGQMEARGDGKVGAELGEWVQKLHHTKVNDQLRARWLDAEGPIDSRRLRLVAAMLTEYLNAPKSETTEGETQ